MGEAKVERVIRIRRKHKEGAAVPREHSSLATGELMAVKAKIDHATATGDWRERKRLLAECIVLVDSVIDLVKEEKGGG